MRSLEEVQKRRQTRLASYTHQPSHTTASQVQHTSQNIYGNNPEFYSASDNDFIENDYAETGGSGQYGRLVEIDTSAAYSHLQGTSNRSGSGNYSHLRSTQQGQPTNSQYAHLATSAKQQTSNYDRVTDMSLRPAVASGPVYGNIPKQQRQDTQQRDDAEHTQMYENVSRQALYGNLDQRVQKGSDDEVFEGFGFSDIGDNNSDAGELHRHGSFMMKPGAGRGEVYYLDNSESEAV